MDGQRTDGRDRTDGQRSDGLTDREKPIHRYAEILRVPTHLLYTVLTAYLAYFMPPHASRFTLHVTLTFALPFAFWYLLKTFSTYSSR